MNDTDPAAYARLRSLFERCADMAPSEREAWFEREAVDTGTRIELELMLAADANGAALLQRDVVDLLEDLDTNDEDPGAAHLLGRRYGAFRLVRLLGRGGQGAVYEAERVDGEFAQTVAVKLLGRGIHDPSEHRRFRRERAILARLEHPGIARLIDGGVSDEGIPYLVMERVDGEPIDRWCAHRTADLDARLRLFERLCTIVAAAHRALIVHRDLKPANVLVATDGEVKVLDFGIARLLDGEDTPSRTAAPMLTPGYAAPEQSIGGPITLSTDVHALGVMLIELITGKAPRQTRRAPSVASGDMPAELAWISAKATEAEPERRYRDATELGDDIARFRLARPVHAHPPSKLYAARKFVRRHRGGVLASTLFLVGVLASAGVALWQAKVAREQAHRADEQAQRAQMTRDFLLNVFKSAQDGLAKDAKPTPEALVAISVQALERDASLPDATRADFLAALGDVARYSNDAAAALPLYERAIALRADTPDSRDRLRAEVMRAMTLSRLGRATEAEAALRPRLDALRAASDAVTVDGLWAYADALGEVGRVDEYLHGMEEARRVAASVPTLELSKVLIIDSSYAIALYMGGRVVDAAAMYDTVLQRWRDAGLPKQRDYAISIANLGALRNELGDFDAAETLLREALDVDSILYGKTHPNTAAQKRMFGQVLGLRGKWDEASAVLTSAQADFATLYGPAHAQSISVASALAALDVERGRNDDALKRLSGVADTCAGITDGTASSECTLVISVQAEALLHTGNFDEAANLARRADKRRIELGGEASTDRAPVLRIEGEALLAQGRATEALERFDRASGLFEAGGMHANVEIADLLVARAHALVALHRAGDALRDIDRATPMIAKLMPVNSHRLHLLAVKAVTLAALGRTDQARGSAREALALADLRDTLGKALWDALQELAAANEHPSTKT